MSGFFGAFRTLPFPTYYPSNKTPVTADVLEAGLIYAICILAFSFFIVLPGIRHKERLFCFIRVTLGLFILASIMLCNFGQEWEVSHIRTKTYYKSGLRKEIKADVGVKIGLRSVNITLKGVPEKQVNETINYNERFHWSNPWGQGRNGFGPFAGRINREFREAQYKGSPYPILWIAEYFTLDGEGIRWGRHYRHAGFYAHILMWLAFPIWILTLMLFSMVILYGGLFMMLTGVILLAANIIYATLRNVTDLEIPFTADNRLIFTWGWCFWLNLITGIVCFILGLIVVALSERFPEALASFFGNDPLNEYEVVYEDPKEIGFEGRPSGSVRRMTDGGEESRTQRPGANGHEAPPLANDMDEPDGEPYENLTPQVPIYRKRTTLFQKSRKLRKPVPSPRAQPAPESPQEEEEEDDYENAPQKQVRYRPADSEHITIDVEHPQPPPRL